MSPHFHVNDVFELYIYSNYRQHIWFTGKSFFGYEDIGDGPGENPAKHVMMLMVTSLNMGWKLPIGKVPCLFDGKETTRISCEKFISQKIGLLISFKNEYHLIRYGSGLIWETYLLIPIFNSVILL